MKSITVRDFLTDDQIQQCLALRNAIHICDQVIQPNIAEINQKLGQENDPKYLAYLVEYVISQSQL